jgi:hypothetical protein
MLVALIYEYGFILPSYRNAETTIDDLVDSQMDGLSKEPITPEQVHEKFGKQPAGGLQDKEHYYVEHYQWRRWLPWKTFDIYVVYEHSDPPNLFNATRPDPPTRGEIPLGVQPKRYEGPIAVPDMSFRPRGPRRPSEGDASEVDPAVAAEAASKNPADSADAAASTDEPASPKEPSADPAGENTGDAGVDNPAQSNNPPDSATTPDDETNSEPATPPGDDS